MKITQKRLNILESILPLNFDHSKNGIITHKARE